MSDQQILTLEQFEAYASSVMLPPFRSQMGAIWFNDIGKKKPNRNWLIKNLLLASTFGIIYGPPGSGKSFITSDLAMTFAASGALEDASPEWFGYRGRRFGVVYLCAEGRDDFEIRVHAWRAQRGVPADAMVPFVLLPTDVDLRSNDVDTKRLIEEIRGISIEMRRTCGVPVELLVIDTVARTIAGGNENASEVMSGFVANCGRIQRELGLAVLGVHHGGKEAGRGPRGHEALHGAADFEFEVEPAGDGLPNRWTVRKLKAGPAGSVHQFRLKQVPVGEDDDGDEITSCVVIGRNSEAPNTHIDRGIPVGDNDMGFLRAVKEAIETRGAIPPTGLDLPSVVTLVVNADDVKRVYWSRQATSEYGSKEAAQATLRQRWGRAHRRMLDRGVIGTSDPWMWMTGKEVRGLPLRGVDGAMAALPGGDAASMVDDMRDTDFEGM